KPRRNESMRNFRPLGDRVLIKRLSTPSRIGSIYLPDQSKEKPTEGLVIATGLGKINMYGELVPVDVKVGQTILFGKFVGSEIELQLEDDVTRLPYVIIREE